MIVEIFVAQCQTEDALRQHLLKRVLDPVGTTAVGEALSEPLDQTEALLGLPQQQSPAVGGQRAGIKLRRHLTPKMGFKIRN